MTSGPAPGSAPARDLATETSEARFEWHGQPQLPRTATTQVREALVPMLMWTSVPVTRRVDEDLTIVDRFMLETALALAPMHPADVEEVTHIPRDAVLRIAGRLAALGLLAASEAGFHAVADAAYEALQRQSAPRYTTAQLTFLYLPDGDDLIAFAPGTGQAVPPILNRAEPVTDRELPPGAAGQLLADFVAERIHSGRVARLPADIVDAHSDDPRVIPATCPVYRCAGHVKRTAEDATLALELKSTSGKKEKCTIPGASGQAGIWEAITTRAPDAARSWEDTILATQEAPTKWKFTLSNEAADSAIRAGIAVSRPGGLWITEPSCIAEVEVTFEPSSQSAALVFALDKAMRELAGTAYTKLAADAAETAVATAKRHYNVEDSELSSEDVELRLWRESYFRHVYALREPSDFAYD